MTNGITSELNELLSFASNLGGYVGNHSTWKVQRTATAPEQLLQVVPLTLLFEAETAFSNRSVRCEYLINSRWLLAQPRVKSSAPWLRRNIDWHVFDDGELCWVYPPHYREVLRKLSRHLERSDLMQTAAYWCVARSADLVEKHLIADQHAVKSWPPQWSAWGHGEKARQQFEDMTRRGKIDVEVEYLLAARCAQAT
jgi:hypothetical protein